MMNGTAQPPPADGPPQATGSSAQDARSGMKGLSSPRVSTAFSESFDDQSVGALSAALSKRTHMDDEAWEVNDARPILPKVAFYMGDLRDGLAMVNMQSAFLMTSKQFTEKQIGILFFVFGMSQVVFMAPVGYFLDSSTQKIRWVMAAGAACSTLTVLTAVLAKPYGANMWLMIVFKVMQGATTAFQPAGLNGITLGIVGSTGFTFQVSRNKMMCHIGTALVVAIASLFAYFLFPNIGLLFCVSPLFCAGLLYYLGRIKPEQINADAARGLIITSPTMTEYEQMDETNEALWRALQEKRRAEGIADDTYFGGGRNGDCCSDGWVGSYVAPEAMQKRPSDGAVGGANGIDQSTHSSSTCSSSDRSPHWSATPRTHSFLGLGFKSQSSGVSEDSMRQEKRPGRFKRAKARIRQALEPMAVLINQKMMIFTSIVFFFHLSNTSVLPLVMQSITLDDAKSGILLSGLCILIAQLFMTIMSKICGDYTPVWGRKRLFLVGLFSLPVRCFMLSTLITEKGRIDSEIGQDVMKILILSTQLLDAVGAGIFGTLYILVTNDISGGSGRFSLMLGVTTGAMCLGGTISGYIGQALAQDFGYDIAFNVLGLMSLIPAFIYLFYMPETLPDYARPKKKRRRKLTDILRGKNPFVTSPTTLESGTRRKSFELV